MAGGEGGVYDTQHRLIAMFFVSADDYVKDSYHICVCGKAYWLHT